MTEEIITSENNQKLAVYCDTCICQNCKRLEQENEKLKKEVKQIGSDFIKKGDYARKLEQENEKLRAEIESFMNGDYCADGCKKMNNAFCDAHIAIINENNKLRSALEEINKIAKEGLQSICYKANCATCRCYSKKISNDTLENIVNDYFDEDGDFTDTEGDFFEVLQAFIDRERAACNKAQPISEKIIDKINEVLK